jgi:methylisocitrate lyase
MPLPVRPLTNDHGRSLRNLLTRKGIIVSPGVFSPTSALLAIDAGFKCAYFSGAGFSSQMGLPDLGVTTLSEVGKAVEDITSVARIPLIVDVDTGFGEVVNVARTVSKMESAGAAAVQIEDQVLPKKCGHLEGKELVDPEEMVKKIIAARRSRKTDLILIARTDANAVEGLDRAIARAKMYVKAGADVIFPEALESRKEFLKFSKSLSVPLLANMTEFGKTPYIKAQEFRSMGYKIVIFPVTAFRVAMRGVEEAFRELSARGTQRGLLKKMMTRSEFYKLIGYQKYESMDKNTLREARELLNKNY